MENKTIEQMTAEEKRHIIRSMGGDTEHLLTILLELQRHSQHSCIDQATAEIVAEEVGLTPAKISDVITFYAMLNDKPSGKYVLEVCNSTPCYYSRSSRVAKILEKELGIHMGETTPDGVFSLRYTPCVGACEIGPVIKVNDEVYGNLTEEKIVALLSDLRSR